MKAQQITLQNTPQYFCLAQEGVKNSGRRPGRVKVEAQVSLLESTSDEKGHHQELITVDPDYF